MTDDTMTVDNDDNVTDKAECLNEKIKVKVEVGDVILEGELKLHGNVKANHIRKPIHKNKKLQKYDNETAAIDEKLKNEIKYELIRNWSIDEEKVQVLVSNNKVTLNGTVASLYQRNEIGRIVYNIPGVNSVDNELIISHL